MEKWIKRVDIWVRGIEKGEGIRLALHKELGIAKGYLIGKKAGRGEKRGEGGGGGDKGYLGNLCKVFSKTLR